ncbi:MAG: hypothetical protein U5N26_05910 [Candidatus Marinimicrobia bacterium]|nr:hypothetical protein [Candidatus Neomarinimicrobiota bacterium]
MKNRELARELKKIANILEIRKVRVHNGFLKKNLLDTLSRKRFGAYLSE